MYNQRFYDGLYYDTPHFFQGVIDGIKPDHIGYVQEPAFGWPHEGTSFSTRMGLLGGVLDQTEGPINNKLFLQAAGAAGVNPEKPYLIDPSYP